MIADTFFMKDKPEPIKAGDVVRCIAPGADTTLYTVMSLTDDGLAIYVQWFSNGMLNGGHGLGSFNINDFEKVE